ncbi:uncharacterized protein Z520_05166 [Fonsecaea multimorphosa CBS 102226]|uniref:Uncharacterized protein n=1 Tax=Fonsecaea multimorphosa CBS 102226 TaxID=1442371 RepID=A0A0D2INV3_9EURO|nr:uncharacterized protein Z520_05166 [Fonsecaea multimorphosa CBS 102226]KIX98706.1 hypothetical protein Z520_05166 [Fonsecaea multimorphosa CBS 102226]OAL32953.1 hypothetical protein AYO22_00038 [Fonsecaea multimorphosa]
MTDHHPANMRAHDQEDPLQSIADIDGGCPQEWSRKCSRCTSVQPSSPDAGETVQPVHPNSDGDHSGSSGSGSSEKSDSNTPRRHADSRDQDSHLGLCFPGGMDTPSISTQASLSFGTQTSNGPTLTEPEEPNESEEETEPRDTGNNRRNLKRKAPRSSESPERVRRREGYEGSL